MSYVKATERLFVYVYFVMNLQNDTITDYNKQIPEGRVADFYVGTYNASSINTLVYYTPEREREREERKCVCVL